MNLIKGNYNSFTVSGSVIINNHFLNDYQSWILSKTDFIYSFSFLSVKGNPALKAKFCLWSIIKKLDSDYRNFLSLNVVQGMFHFKIFIFYDAEYLPFFFRRDKFIVKKFKQ